MEDYFYSIVDANEIPLFTAFLLGFLVSVNPCTFATNVMVLGFLSKEIDNRWHTFINGIIYTIGRVLSFTILGVACLVVLKQGMSIFKLQFYLCNYGGYILAPTLIIFAALLMWGSKLPLQKFGYHADDSAKKYSGTWGSFILGVLFALAFCPISGMIFFAMLLPIAAVEPGGYFYPTIFGIASSLVVIVLAWIFAFAVSYLGTFYNKVGIIQKWLTRLIALLFLIGGLYEFAAYYLRII